MYQDVKSSTFSISHSSVLALHVIRSGTAGTQNVGLSDPGTFPAAGTSLGMIIRSIVARTADLPQPGLCGFLPVICPRLQRSLVQHKLWVRNSFIVAKKNR